MSKTPEDKKGISQQRILDKALKPCPKCAAKVGINVWDVDDGSEDGETYYKVVCCSCYIQTKTHLSTNAAIADWNDRPAYASQPAQGEAALKLASFNKNMAEQYMRHDYRAMWDIWQMFMASTTTAPASGGEREKDYECQHDWQFIGTGHNGSVYECSKCGYLNKG